MKVSDEFYSRRICRLVKALLIYSETLDAIDDLQEVFRIRWLCGFKPYGLNGLQIRLGQLSDDPVDAFEPH